MIATCTLQSWDRLISADRQLIYLLKCDYLRQCCEKLFSYTLRHQSPNVIHNFTVYDVVASQVATQYLELLGQSLNHKYDHPQRRNGGLGRPLLAPILCPFWTIWHPLPSFCQPLFWRHVFSLLYFPAPGTFLAPPIIFCPSIDVKSEFWHPLKCPRPPCSAGLQGLSLRHWPCIWLTTVYTLYD